MKILQWMGDLFTRNSKEWVAVRSAISHMLVTN